MKTRIDHATVITPRNDEVLILNDTTITLDDGVIVFVGPTRDSLPMPPKNRPLPSIEACKGRPLGSILIAMGQVTKEQVQEALDKQKTAHGVIGQTLADMGYVSEYDIEWAMAAQAGRLLPGFSQADEVINARNKLVIPGFINTHHHLYQSLTRCMKSVQNAPLFDWLTHLYPRWRELTHDTLQQAATISIAELLLGGCTCTSDHHYLFPQGRDADLEAVFEAAAILGIRIHVCRGSMSLGQSAGGLPPDTCIQNEETILADCRRTIEKFHDAKPMSMQRVDLAPCSPFSITPELLDQTVAMGKEYNVLLHTHAAETLDEERFCLEKFGTRPIEYLHRHNWLAPNVYLAHCVHLNADEIALLARTQTGVAHCPCSNMRLGSGIAPIREMLAAGMKVGLAVDGSSSNDGGNLIAEARQALLLQRVKHGGDGMTTADAFRLGTAGSAAVLHRHELGRIEPNCAGDLVMYDANDIALAGAVAQDPLGALMLCNPPRPDRVIVNGKTVVSAGRVNGVDWPKFVADFNRMVQKLFRP